MLSEKAGERMETVKGIVPADNARGKLFYAFLEIIDEKPFEKIKVSELIEKANVNRSTFYRYYSDIYDYFDRICTGGLFYSTSGLDKCAENKSLKDGLDEFYSLLTSRIDIFSDIAKKIVGRNGNITFLKKFRGNLIDRLEEAFRPATAQDEALLLCYVEKTYIYLLNAVCGDADFDAIENNDYVYSTDKGVIDNIIDCFSRGNGTVFKKLMTASANIFLTKEPRSLNINNITKNASVSRTEFYNYFGNAQKMIDGGLDAAIHVYTQIVFAFSVCNEDDFYKAIPELDFSVIANPDTVIELARRHREYYYFVSNSTSVLMRMLKKHLAAKGIYPNEKQSDELFAYSSLAVIGFIAYADGLHDDEFKNRILWAKKHLSECGLQL